MSTTPVPVPLDEPTPRGREWPLYVGAFVTYVPVAIWEKFLLNWIVGPLWLILWVEIGTRLRRWRRTTRAARAARVAGSARSPAPESV